MSQHCQMNRADVLDRALDRALDIASENLKSYKTEKAALLFMAKVSLAKMVPENELVLLVAEHNRDCFRRVIAPALKSSSDIYRKRALTLTFCLVGIHPNLVAQFMSITSHQVRRLLRRLRRGVYDRLFKRHKEASRYESKEIRDHLFDVLHAPPSAYNINRTTWTIDLLHDVLKDSGTLIGKNSICRIIKGEGYTFRKTREVLTSNDPSYREKLQDITRTLQQLGPADRFFSIDEYGPVSVRERGGRRRARRSEKPTIPQYQVSKGNVTVTAALELGSNQITHFYSPKKDTEEMIKLLHRLLEQYRDCRCLYLSWDAASWHSSKAFLAEVERVNHCDYRKTHETPAIKLQPLPARAQFLNVIESVFSGLSQSVIHNSNYQSVEEMKAAIDRYIAERNEHFRLNPRKAGNKIWGSEQVPAYFSVSHNCKNPRLMSVAGIR
ncbi:IS630 family transposase [Methylobacterium nigriterrae]|uniref:IS630 family transposase n=1 Tax=Methylobacterium nigriterrae TaxID=3127512 RepID=UPI003013EF84